MPLDIDIARAARDPAVEALDFSALAPKDLVNLVLQRSEVLFDTPNRGAVIKAWTRGDEAPVAQAVERMGLEIARRVAGIVHAEFREMLPVLESLAPRRVADIGCGYALFDLFMARHFGTEHLLIDIETNDRRDFGYEKEAAAYTDMDVARQLMEANGVAAERVKTVNPERADPLAVGPVDLAVSFKSCGFHYPISTYMPFFESAVTPGGAVIVDLRARTADAQALELAALGVIEALTPPETKARRVLMRKAGD